MNIEIQTTLSQNITVVYDSIDLTLIDSGKIKRLRGNDAQAILMDTPDMVVAIFPPEPMIVQIGDRRIRLTLQGKNVVGNIPLWDFISECAKLIPKTNSNIIAFGFNYDVRIVAQNEAAMSLLKRRFLGDASQIEQALESELQSFTPRFKYSKNDITYDLIFEPNDEQHFLVHMNAHFGDQNRLPSPGKLQSSFLAQYQYLVETVSRLLEVE